MVRMAIRHYHLRERDSPEHLFDGISLMFYPASLDTAHRSNRPPVVESYIRENDSLPVVESDVEVPLLPVNGPAIHSEAHTLRLGDVDRLEVIAKTRLSLRGLGVVVRGRSGVERSSDFRNINVHDLLGLDVVYGAKVQRIRILHVINGRPVIHECLLQPLAVRKPLIISEKEVSTSPPHPWFRTHPIVHGSQ